MPVHFVQDLGPESLVKPYATARTVCGQELREAHEIVRPESDADICTDCLSWSKRNRYQDKRCVVEMGVTLMPSGGEDGRKKPDGEVVKGHARLLPGLFADTKSCKPDP